MPKTAKIRIGISGWNYAPWRGTFYPRDLPHKRELEYASRMLSTIEINGTFYSLQNPSTFARWYDQTPSDFIFSVKGSRYITHLKRARNVGAALANFFLSGMLRLNEKLGPLLWQFPPNFQFEPVQFESFLTMLPRSTREILKLKKHLNGIVKQDDLWTKIDEDRPLRHAVEIRHESFASRAFVNLLRRQNVALVLADTAGRWPMLHDVTADFVYIRLHGAEELYASGYSRSALDEWAEKIRAFAQGGDAPSGMRAGSAARKRRARDVFVYFDNDVKVRAPFDAARLAMKLGLRDQALKAGRIRSSESPRSSWPTLARRG